MYMSVSDHQIIDYSNYRNTCSACNVIGVHVHVYSHSLFRVFVSALPSFFTNEQTTSADDTDDDERSSEGPVRLPRSWNPLHYNLHITPDFYDRDATPTFKGSVEMCLRCDEATSQISFQSQVQLVIDTLQVLADDGSTLNFTGPPSCSGIQDICTLTLDDVVPVGSVVRVKVEFWGKIYSDLEGMYWMDYKDSNGTDRYM